MRSELLTDVLCRTGINRGQITLLKALYKEDDDFVPIRDDGYVARSDLAKIRRMKTDQLDSLNGVLGAFGGRINETNGISGKPGIDAFIDKTRINDEMHYRLQSEAREAIENVPTLLNKFSESWSELLDPDTYIESDELVAKSE